MKYKSTNELDQFSFQEASIADISFHGGTLAFDLDNVTILSNNRHNRDIQNMRANNVILTFTDVTLNKVIAEGYKVYDADFNLSQTIDDTIIEEKDYTDLFKSFAGLFMYNIENTEEHHCIINIDGETQTYCMDTTYNQAIVEWDRFLKKSE